MARWRALLLCAALLAAAGTHVVAAEEAAADAADAAADVAPPPDFSTMRVKQLQARAHTRSPERGAQHLCARGWAPDAPAPHATQHAQALLSERGVECKGCSEKADLVARVAETWHMPPKPQQARLARPALRCAAPRPLVVRRFRVCCVRADRA
jgi:hypothetical protein